MIDNNLQHYSILALSPFKQYGDYFIAATSEENGYFLKVIKFNPLKEGEDCFENMSKIEVSNQITCLAWSSFTGESDQEYLGIILAGHENGLLSLWSVNQLINYSDSNKQVVDFGLIKAISDVHSSKLNCIQFNQKQVNLAATASDELTLVQIVEESNGSFDISVSFQAVNDEDKSEITSVSWNDKVAYIIAVACRSAVVYVWDMKKKKIHLRIKDQALAEEDNKNNKLDIKTSVTWASDGVQIIIAYDDNEYNFLTQYHVSQLTAPYAEYHGGHKKAITDIIKNPYDSNFILSIGRDNSVTCWSIRTQKSFGTTTFNKSKITQVLWSAKFPDCFITLFENNKIEITQINFSQNPSLFLDEEEEIPKWMNKKVFSNFAWGGKFITVNEKLGSQLGIHTIDNANTNLTKVMSDFIHNFESNSKDKNNFSKFIDNKISMLEELNDNNNNVIDKNLILMWVALKSVFTNDYQSLFKYFGYEKEKLLEEANINIGRKTATKKLKGRETIKKDKIKAKDNAEDIFGRIGDMDDNVNRKEFKEVEKEEPNTYKIETTRNLNWNLQCEKFIKAGLLAGDLEVAMENAFKADRDCEALLIASCNPDLFQKAKQKYFHKSNDLFIKNIFSSIINKNFNQLLSGNMKDWKEYILYALTYLSNEEFKDFSNSLGNKLQSMGDLYSSLVCFVLGGQSQLILDRLYENYLYQISNQDRSDFEKESLLHTLFEQIITVNYTFNSTSNNEVTSLITVKYCELLVSHKLYTQACGFLSKINNTELNTLLLYDRIYGNNEDILSGLYRKPNLPFKEINVKNYVPPQNKAKYNNINDINNNNNNNNNNKNNNKLSNSSNNNVKLSQKNDVINNDINKINQLNNNFNNQNKFPNNSMKPPMTDKNIKNNFNNNINKNINFNNNNFANPIPNNNVQLNNSNISDSNNLNIEAKKSSSIRPPSFKPPMNINKPPIINKPMGNGIINNKTSSVKSSNPFSSNNVNDNNINNEVYNQINPSTNNSNNNNNNNTNSDQLDEDETKICQSFDNYRNMYNSSFPEGNKQKDMNNKIDILFSKLKKHDIKPVLKMLLIQFIDSMQYIIIINIYLIFIIKYLNVLDYDSGVSRKEMNILVTKIQSNQWDQNKTWMPCLDKLVSFRK